MKLEIAGFMIRRVVPSGRRGMDCQKQTQPTSTLAGGNASRQNKIVEERKECCKVICLQYPDQFNV
jgi:hypothetical protein